MGARVSAACNRQLEHEVVADRFRQHLFWYLSVVRVHLPALDERRDDAVLPAQHCMRSLAQR